MTKKHTSGHEIISSKGRTNEVKFLLCFDISSCLRPRVTLGGGAASLSNLVSVSLYYSHTRNGSLLCPILILYVSKATK